ncbi:SURF1 family protein [Microbacterium sp. BWT-B31]|uniref:SURF1 family cytochrome oxidase biogenesis protein n=1 Tax=Microbacterium sp. BWT-B31 TaxID=3232072 RepID=UPI00352958B4
MSLKTARPAVRWSVYVLVAIVFAVACGFLSNWQFSRNTQRAAQLALVAANYHAPPVSLDEAIPSGSALDPADEWQPVELVGQYLPADQLLARNRAHGGTAAYEVLVPFRTENGRVLLIDRGWLAPGSAQPLPDEIPAAPEGEARVIVRLRPGEPVPSSGRGADEGQVPTINLPLVAEQLSPAVSDALEQSAYGLMVSEDPAPATRPQTLESPSDDPGPHLSYAIQWILFAVMGFVFIGYIIRTERARRREDAEEAEAAARTEDESTDAAAVAPAEDEKPAPAPLPRRRHRDRDAEDEDALLDTAGR